MSRSRHRILVLVLAVTLGPGPVAAEAPHRDKAVLLSVKPEFAREILEGYKGFELRRARPRWAEGTPVLLYASTSSSAKARQQLTQRSLVGSFRAGKIHEGSPLELWLTLGSATGETYDSLCGYLNGRPGCAIEVLRPRTLPTPLSLDRLRRDLGGFSPPQNYQYVDSGYLLQALEESRRSGQGPTPPSAPPRAEGSSPRAWIASRDAGAEQLFVYHPGYNLARRGGDAFCSVACTKPAQVHQALVEAGVPPTRRLRPAPLGLGDLLRVHTGAYVKAVLTGEPGGLAMSQGFGGEWSPEVARQALLAGGGTFTAAKFALARKTIVGNLAAGSHHASAGVGNGFGTFNGPVLAARKLVAEGLAQRVMIVDGDIHYGGATNLLTLGDPSVAYVSVYGVATGQPYTGGNNQVQPVPRNASAAEYLALLSDNLARAVDRFRPQLIIYSASADPYHGDPTNAAAGLQLSRRDLKQRDAFVFALARTHGIPVCWELGGGYADRSKLVQIHTNTARAADEVLAHVHPGDRLQMEGQGSSWSAGGGVVRFPRWQVSPARRAELFGPAPLLASEAGIQRLAQRRQQLLDANQGQLPELEQAYRQVLSDR